jgi:hypothetical protein
MMSRLIAKLFFTLLANLSSSLIFVVALAHIQFRVGNVGSTELQPDSRYTVVVTGLVKRDSLACWSWMGRKLEGPV